MLVNQPPQILSLQQISFVFMSLTLVIRLLRWVQLSRIAWFGMDGVGRWRSERLIISILTTLKPRVLEHTAGLTRIVGLIEVPLVHCLRMVRSSD